jgi:hypothetical protein
MFLGFTKQSECRMVGEQIALTCLLRLRDALKSTTNSKEFMDLNNFKPETFVLSNDNFWLYLFVMRRALYAPMRVLHLADQQVPGMENSTITFYRQIGCYSGGCLMQRSEYQCSAVMVHIMP